MTGATGRWGEPQGNTTEQAYSGADVSYIMPDIADVSAQLDAAAKLARPTLVIDNATGKVIGQTMPKAQAASAGAFLTQLMSGNGKWVMLAVGVVAGIMVFSGGTRRRRRR
jgi:hypothetical protein